ncbi:hypothetical protein PVAP13_2KG324667 [Panicum virgatum]|uniref:Uncharacterized protein n=1 Tax=Panicum virgatum TaxID=38727 RepID=A0A8T0W941_PANVG|nr:hypothetical protein PVAP13_2KG324667 [Panicum virgatum]
MYMLTNICAQQIGARAVACRSTVHLCSRIAGIQRAPLISSGLMLVVSACRITPR